MDLHAPSNIVELAAWIIVLSVAIPLAFGLLSIIGALIAAPFEAGERAMEAFRAKEEDDRLRAEYRRSLGEGKFKERYDLLEKHPWLEWDYGQREEQASRDEREQQVSRMYRWGKAVRTFFKTDTPWLR